jgi:hypothetical protein
MRYVISYDLIAPNKNYQPLYDALASVGARRILLSQWIVRWDNVDSPRIRDWVRQYVDSNDRVFVDCIDRAQDWAGLNLMVDPNKI